MESLKSLLNCDKSKRDSILEKYQEKLPDAIGKG